MTYKMACKRKNSIKPKILKSGKTNKPLGKTIKWAKIPTNTNKSLKGRHHYKCTNIGKRYDK